MILNYLHGHDVFSSCSSPKENSQVTELPAETPLPDPAVTHPELLPGLVASFLGTFDSLEEWQSGCAFAAIVQLGQWEQRNTKLSSFEYQSKVRHTL